MRPRSRAETVFAAGIVFLAVAASAEDWPCFLGPKGDCSSPETGINKDWRARPPKELWRVGLSDKLRRFPSQLSHGERQRVAVCRATLAKPALLLADEPTGNLDPRNSARVVEMLIDIAKQEGATLLTVTHDHSLLDRFERVIDFETFGDGR